MPVNIYKYVTFKLSSKYGIGLLSDISGTRYGK